MSNSRMTVTYRVAGDAKGIEARARGIAIEQSVECPLEAIGERQVIDDIVGRVEGIAELSPGSYEVRIGLATATAPAKAGFADPGQLINMLFGNSSIQADVTLQDVELPAEYPAAFGGPRVGVDGLRALTMAHGRALTASALKPQGLAAGALGVIAGRLAAGGVDIIKDDHGLADQAYAPFAARVRACAKAIAVANTAGGHHAIYAPNLTGNLDQLRRELQIVRDEGVAAVMMAPMIVGVAAFHQIVKEADGIAVMAHPAMAGAARIAPPLLLGKLFRLLGADITVFPNYGGRFAYSEATCRELAHAALGPAAGLKSCLPAPAGGLTLARVPELIDFYGRDVLLLIGGSLLAARERLTEEAALFVSKVESHGRT